VRPSKHSYRRGPLISIGLAAMSRKSTRLILSEVALDYSIVSDEGKAARLLPVDVLASVPIRLMIFPLTQEMGKRINRRRKKAPSAESIAARKAGLVLTLTRRDALVRLLDTATWLWFLGHDPLSIHLIAMAAHRVLYDLGKKIGKAPVARMYLSEEKFTVGYDWLRHASSDPDDYIDFPLRTNEVLLWDALISFEEIFGGANYKRFVDLTHDVEASVTVKRGEDVTTPYMKTFQAYFVLWLVPEDPRFREGLDAFLPEGVKAEDVSSLSRTEFFVKVTEMFVAGKPVQ
jgi:hypothetical protein